jgi:hypothetical protein
VSSLLGRLTADGAFLLSPAARSRPGVGPSVRHSARGRVRVEVMEPEPLIPGAPVRCADDPALASLLPEARLWCAVLRQAAHELSSPRAYRRRKAREWIEANSEEVGDFLWVCAMLKLEPEPLRRRLLTIPAAGS